MIIEVDIYEKIRSLYEEGESQGLAYHAKPLKSTVKVIPTLMYAKHTIGNVMSLPMM